MNKITNIHEYRKLNKILKELPEVLAILNKCQQDLYKYMHYREVGFTSNTLNETKSTIESTITFCKKQLERDFNK